MKYKLKLDYCEGPYGGELKSIESPIFDFPNPIMPGQSINIFGNVYLIYGEDNGKHILDENGAYTVINLIEPRDLHGSNWKPDPQSKYSYEPDAQSKMTLENKLSLIKQDFAKLDKSPGGK